MRLTHICFGHVRCVDANLPISLAVVIVRVRDFRALTDAPSLQLLAAIPVHLNLLGHSLQRQLTVKDETRVLHGCVRDSRHSAHLQIILGRTVHH